MKQSRISLILLTLIMLGLFINRVNADLVNARKNLQHGRFYRKDSKIVNGNRTPTLDSLRTMYTQVDGSGFSSRDYLIAATQELAELLATDPGRSEVKELLSQAANELLRGQSLVGNKMFRDALAVVYPVNLPDNSDADMTPGIVNHETVLDKEKPQYENAIAEYEKAVKVTLDLFRRSATEGAIRSSGTAFPAYPQFTRIVYPTNEGFAMPSENVLTETVQMTRIMRQWSLAHLAVASRLYLLAAKDIKPNQPLPDRAAQAKLLLKRAGHGAFLQAALMASKQDVETYQQNFGLEINSNVQLARETFDALNKRLPPAGRPKDFISSSDINVFVNAAQTAVTDALQWEREARQLSKAYNENLLFAYNNEMDRQSTAFKTPLEELSGIDVQNDLIELPDKTRVTLNNLQAGVDIERFKNEVTRRIGVLLDNPMNYQPNDDQNDLGTLASAILRINDAKISIDRAQDTLNKIPQEVNIVKQQYGKIMNASTVSGSIIDALELSIGVVSSFQKTVNVTKGSRDQSGGAGQSGTLPTAYQYLDVSVVESFDPRTLVIAGLKTAQNVANQLKEMATLSANQDAEVNKILLGISTAIYNLESAKYELIAAKSSFEQEIDRMERLIDDLRRAQVTADQAWFNDPAYAIELGASQIRAKDSLINAIARVYDLAKAMGYVWSEDYITPVKDRGIPVRISNVNQPGNTFWEFTSPDDIFSIANAQSCADAIQTLKNWDALLRDGIGASDGKGPFREAQGANIVSQPISLRKDMLNLAPYSVPQQVVLMRDYIQKNSFLNGTSFMIKFPIKLEAYKYDTNTQLFVNPHFDFNAWNQTVDAIAVRVTTDEGFYPTGANNRGVIQVWLAVTGETTKRTYFGQAQTSGAVGSVEAFKRITVPEFQRLDLLTNAGLINDSNKFIDRFLASVNGASPTNGGWPSDYVQAGGNGPYYRINSKLKNLPVGATGWYLIISAADAQNLGININKIRDVELFIRYNTGAPPKIFTTSGN